MNFSIVVILIDHFPVTQKRKKLPSCKVYRKKLKDNLSILPFTAVSVERNETFIIIIIPFLVIESLCYCSL